MSLEIVVCPPDRFAELFSVAETAFSESLPPDLVARVGRQADRERFFTAIDGGRLVASSGTFTLRLTVPGGELPAGGITFVTVLPTHRRQGLLSGMMRRMISDCRDRGEPLAMLWASEAPIYQRFGFGLATTSVNLEAETRSTRYAREWPRTGSFRFLSPAESLPVIGPIYEAVRAQRPGFLSRTPAWWEGILPDPVKDRQGGEAKRVVVYETEDGPEAYAIYNSKAEWSVRGTAGQLIVAEAFGTTPRGTREIWRYLFDVDLIRTLRTWRLPPDHPVLVLVAEPRRLGTTTGDGLWLRILDLPAALEGRTYGANGRLIIQVADAYCDWNAGRWMLEVDGGRARVARSDGEAGIALDANDLASLYLGGFTATALAAAGRIVELRPGGIALADRLFRTPLQPWCPQEF